MHLRRQNQLSKLLFFFKGALLPLLPRPLWSTSPGAHLFPSPRSSCTCSFKLLVNVIPGAHLVSQSVEPFSLSHLIHCGANLLEPNLLEPNLPPHCESCVDQAVKVVTMKAMT